MKFRKRIVLKYSRRNDWMDAWRMTFHHKAPAASVENDVIFAPAGTTISDVMRDMKPGQTIHIGWRGPFISPESAGGGTCAS